MHDVGTLVVSKYPTHWLRRLGAPAAAARQLPLSEQCVVMAANQYDERRVALLCIMRTKCFLFVSDGLATELMWKSDDYPERHGLAIGKRGRAWISTGTEIVELRNWKETARHPCPAAGALSVDCTNRVVAACGGDGLRDALFFRGQRRTYAGLTDVIGVQGLVDNTVLVVDHVCMRRCSIKVVGEHGVLKVLQNNVPCQYIWSGACARADDAGIISVSDLPDAEVKVLGERVAPRISPMLFEPSRRFVAQWPGQMPTIMMVLWALRSRLPTELVYYVLGFW